MCRSRPGTPIRAPRTGAWRETALAEVEKLERDERLSGYHYLPAIKADLLSRLGLTGEAADFYRPAFDLAAQEPERASSPSRSPITPSRMRTKRPHFVSLA